MAGIQLLVASCLIASATAFVPVLKRPLSMAFAPLHPHPRKCSVLKLSGMESDFASAMPPKPEQTWEEKLSDSATEFIASIESSLAEGVPVPPEMDALREARDSGADKSVMAARIYELMIEQGMLYDVDETGTLTLTQFDIKAQLDVPEVKEEFSRLYRYGMALIQQGLLEVDTVKSIVKDRLIDRTGLSPEEFDAWLGY